MIEVLNRQNVVKLNDERYALFTERALRVINETGGRKPVVAFIDDEEMKGLNAKVRGKATTTDVLSFSYGDDEFEQDGSLGDIVISVEKSALQAAEHEVELDVEIMQLILHGILHLCGYDHETDQGEMNKREIELRAELGIA